MFQELNCHYSLNGVAHKKEVETRCLTLETRRCSTSIEHKSAITDHADRHNCVMDWEGAKVVDKRLTGVRVG